jgi:predicted RNA-binding Zn ribbon-like protein
MGNTARPRTADGDSFRFRANRPSLDLCSTLLWRYGAQTDLLRRPADLARWMTEARLCSTPITATADDLVRARSLREAIYRLVQAHLRDAEPPAVDVDLVNVAAAHPERAPQITSDGQVRWISRRPVAEAFAAVARDCIDVLTAGPLTGRLRECGAPDCAFLFIDTSRAGARRWCATNRCGNREHVRHHRSRLGGSAPGAP